MKKIKKALLTVGVLCFAGVSAIAMGSCKDDGKGGAKSYVYKFNTNGGVEISNATVKAGDAYVLPTPEREGYSFEGWYTDAEFTGEPVTEVIAAANVTYYAKWTQLAVITLELNGGTLAEDTPTTLYLKAGENVFDFVAEYVPVKEGLTFGAWFDGDSALSETAKMPEDGITLSAKYKVEYTVELYKRNIDDTDYNAPETETLTAYVGEEVVSDDTVEGFKEVSTDETVDTLVLTEIAANNVLKRYFERQSFTVTFNPNLPSSAGVTLEKEVITEKYEVPVEMKSDYVCEGYVLVGWSTTAKGEIEYKANYISSVLHNKTEEDEKRDTITPVRNTVLYGVWVKGYTDFFGGNDYLFVLDSEDEVAYLSRGNVFYKCEYDPDKKTFELYDENDDLMTEGKLYDSKTYIYYSADRDDIKATLTTKDGLDETTTINFDPYNGIEYTDANGVSKGTYTYNLEENYYVATFTDGALKGKKKTFVLGKDVDGKKNTFTLRGDEANWGKLSRFAVEEGALVVYDNENSIKLDGFGKAIYVNKGEEQEYFYELDGDLLILTELTGDMYGTAILMNYNNKRGYCRYVEATVQTYEFTSGDKLETDGGCQATYTKGGKVINGFYQSEESLLGGTLITMLTKDGNHVFTLISVTEKQPVLDENGEETGETEMVTYSTIVEKNPAYKEYKYQARDGSAKTFVITLNEPEENYATLYAYKPSTGTFLKASEGTYTLNEETGNYLYEAKKYFNPKNVITSPFDPNTIKACVFAVDTESLSYGVSYWYSVTPTEGEIMENVTEYEAKDGGKLTMVGGYAFLTKASGVKVAGPISVNGMGLVTLENTEEKIYLEVNEDEKTFVQLEFKPYFATFLKQDGLMDMTKEFRFDGKGGVIYEVTEFAEEDDGEDIVTQYPGTSKNLNISSAFEAPIMEFKSDDGQFTIKYIMLTAVTGAVYIATYNEEYNGTYESSNSVVTIDGFGFSASFVDASGKTHEGRYALKTEEDGSVYIQFNDSKLEKYYYFDLKDNKKFTQRGEEYGEYLLMENRYIHSYCEFNGYGTLKVYDKVYNEETNKYDRDYIDEKGTYTIKNGVVTINYKADGKAVEFTGSLSTYLQSGKEQLAFIAKNSYGVRVYVNQADWSTLALNEDGTAIKYTREGVKEEGYYTLVTKDFLYYESKDGSNACLFEYSYTDGTATPITYKARGYYTSTLEALHFSSSGFAIFGGETSYYYKIGDDKETVTIYRQDPTNKDANDFGFIAEVFGKFTATKEWDGKDYYYNDGYALDFKRDTTSDTLYPVQLKSTEETKYPLQGLSFQPTGSGEFSTSGTVYINGQAQACKVIREINDAGEAKLYVQWGFYRFYIEVNYTGRDDQGNSNNSYTIVGMEYVHSMYSYVYLDMYYFYASMGFPGLQDMCGMVSIIGQYDEEGNAGEFHIEADFMDGLHARDLTGELISFKDGSYAYDATTQIYSSRFKGSDGKTYGLHFQSIYQAAFDLHGYGIMAFTYEQQFDLGDGYTVEVEKVLWTQAKAVTENTVYAVRLYKDGELIKHEGILASENTIYYIERERAEPTENEKQGKVLSTKYYKIDFTPMTEDTPLLDGREGATVTLFDSAALSVENIKTIYSSNGKLFVDYSLDREEITLIAMVKRSYIGQETIYDEENKVYTVSVSGGKVFTVTMIDENTVEIMEKADV